MRELITILLPFISLLFLAAYFMSADQDQAGISLRGFFEFGSKACNHGDGEIIRKMRTATSLILLLLLAGCAGHSIACFDSIARSDCPPDSPAGQAMEEQRKAAQTFADIDEARCKSYGAPGSQAYARCRASLEKERSKSLTTTPK